MNQTTLMGKLQGNIWNLQRFGFTPSKLIHRINHADIQCKIVCISIPKAGTHLLERALCLHPGLYRKFARTVHEENHAEMGGIESLLKNLRRKEILVTHLFHSPDRAKLIRQYGAKPVFIARDPRDIVVSDMHYILRMRDHKLHGQLTNTRDPEERLKTVITGRPNYESIAYRLEKFKGWLTECGAVVRFEDLVGPRGGGALDRQIECLRNLFAYLGIAMTGDGIESIRSDLFSRKSPTYRSGQIGGWKQCFSAGLKDVFKAEAGAYLREYGYEESDNW